VTRSNEQRRREILLLEALRLSLYEYRRGHRPLLVLGRGDLRRESSGDPGFRLTRRGGGGPCRTDARCHLKALPALADPISDLPRSLSLSHHAFLSHHPLPPRRHDSDRVPNSSPLTFPADFYIQGSSNSLWSKWQDMQCVENCADPDPANHVLYEQPVWQTLQMFRASLSPYHFS
jgi:hypothetical protein